MDNSAEVECVENIPRTCKILLHVWEVCFLHRAKDISDGELQTKSSKLQILVLSSFWISRPYGEWEPSSCECLMPHELSPTKHKSYRNKSYHIMWNQRSMELKWSSQRVSHDWCMVTGKDTSWWTTCAQRNKWKMCRKYPCKMQISYCIRNVFPAHLCDVAVKFFLQLLVQILNAGSTYM